MMSYLWIFAFCVALSAADVSHLPAGYLPPVKQVEHAISTSIEHQELRELPEQVEYMRDLPESALPAGAETKMTPMMNYLPPISTAMSMEAKPAEPAAQPEQMLSQVEVAQAQAPESAPEAESAAPMQLTYQQYMEQLMQMQEQAQEGEQSMPVEEPMTSVLEEVQQPMAPSDVETLAFEPEPAHELRADGYHYKAAQMRRRLRL